MMRRARLNAPNIENVDPRYLDQCTFALEPSITRLIDLAVEAGQRVLYSLMFMAAEKANAGISKK